MMKSFLICDSEETQIELNDKGFFMKKPLSFNSEKKSSWCGRPNLFMILSIHTFTVEPLLEVH